MIFNDVVEKRTAVHVTVLGFGVAVGAPELLRGRTGARNIALLGLSNFAERGVGSRLPVVSFKDKHLFTGEKDLIQKTSGLLMSLGWWYLIAQVLHCPPPPPHTAL